MRPLLHRAPTALRAAKWWNPDFGWGARVPGSKMRWLLFKVFGDLQGVPGISVLTQAFARCAPKRS